MTRFNKALRWLRWTALASAAGLAAQERQPDASPEVPQDKLDEIVVSRRKQAPPATPDAIDYLQRFCFDPNRRTGQSAPPVEYPGWQPLDEVGRAKFSIADPAVPAFEMFDKAREQTFLLKFETIETSPQLVENRCTLVVMGGSDHAPLIGRIASLFRGAATQRHAGHVDGVDKIEGWRQWLWTAIPSRHSDKWQAINGKAGGRRMDSWVVVTHDSFYKTADYVYIDLKTRLGDDTRLSMISFGYKTQKPLKR